MEPRTGCLRPFRLPGHQLLRTLRSRRVPAETHRSLPRRGPRHSPIFPRHPQRQQVEHPQFHQTHGAWHRRATAAGHSTDLGPDGARNHAALPEETFPLPQAPGPAGQPVGRLRAAAVAQHLRHARDDRRALPERCLVSRGRQRPRCPDLRERHRTGRRSRAGCPGRAGDPRGERTGGRGPGAGSPRPRHARTNPSRAGGDLERGRSRGAEPAPRPSPPAWGCATTRAASG